MLWQLLLFSLGNGQYLYEYTLISNDKLHSHISFRDKQYCKEQHSNFCVGMSVIFGSCDMYGLPSMVLKLIILN